MESIRISLARVKLGQPQGSDALCVVPLLDPDIRAARYESLRAALAATSLSITELDAGGSVAEVKAVNDGAIPVLLIDGAALVGAKQNRVLNLTVLLPPKQTTVIPVSCVEQGRWQANSAAFSDGESLHFARGRAAKMASVTASCATHGSPHSDQRGVWDDMTEYRGSFQADAPSGSMQDIYDAVRQPVDELINALHPVAQQAGAAFIARGEVLGIELFDAHATLMAEWPKLARSYAVDALGNTGVARTDAASHARALDETRQLMDQIAVAPWSRYPGVGLGDNLHLGELPPYSGAALEYDGELVHLAVLRRAARTA